MIGILGCTSVHKGDTVIVRQVSSQEGELGDQSSPFDEEFYGL